MKNDFTNDFTIEEVAGFWDKIAEKYDETNLKFKETHNQRFEEAIKHLDLKPGDKILNIWSRTGGAIPFLRKKCEGARVINMEAAEKFIEIAKNKFPDEEFLKTDLKNLPFENNCFDFILSLETLEHTPCPLSLLKEFHRVIKPEGTLVMSIPPKTAGPIEKISVVFFRNHGEGPHQFLSSKNVKKMAKTAGFRILLHKGTLFIPAGPKWLKNLGEKIMEKSQNTFISELGIRQFYVCRK